MARRARGVQTKEAVVRPTETGRPGRLRKPRNSRVLRWASRSRMEKAAERDTGHQEDLIGLYQEPLEAIGHKHTLVSLWGVGWEDRLKAGSPVGNLV